MFALTLVLGTLVVGTITFSALLIVMAVNHATETLQAALAAAVEQVRVNKIEDLVAAWDE